LVGAGLIEAHGVKKGRTYPLSAKVYQKLGQSADYVRQAGFDPIRQEQMVIQYVKKHGKIMRNAQGVFQKRACVLIAHPVFI
jgi:ATP-dependent DNA helicase RecG